jgi:membrane associated rhomboid family serine protease
MFAGINRADLISMFILMGAIFALEMAGVFNPKLVTITQILKNFIPMPVRIMVLAWLVWHFMISDIIRQLTPKA